jgi:flagellar operon protein
MSIVDIENRILGVPTTGGVGSPAATPANGTSAKGPSFDQLLQGQLESQAAKANIKFSGHAQTRMLSRQINLTGDDISKIGDAITRAAAKGARESLILTDKAALVVSVPNRTVITAVDKFNMKENVFTNIDSAMII